MFRPSHPVTHDGFFNRDRELARLVDHVERLRAGGPSWVALLGLRKIGKTSLLLELARRTAGDQLPFVLIDSHEFGLVETSIVRRYAIRVADAVLGPEIGSSLEAAAHQPAAFRAALLHSKRFARLDSNLQQLLLELPEVDDPSNLLREYLQLPENLAKALDLHIVVAWDEFQALTSMRGKQGDALIQVMRAVWQHHQRVEYIVSGSERTLLRDMLTSYQAPFFQHFAILELDPMAAEDGVRLLVDSAPNDRPIDEATAREAVDLLGGHPFYLQLFGEELTALAPPYDRDTLKQAIQTLLFARTGRLALFFEGEFRSVVGKSTYLAAVLEALAAGPKGLSELARAIGTSAPAAKRYIERVGDTVVAVDGTYRLADGVFGLWLSWRSPGGTVVPMSVLGDEGEVEAARHLARLGFDLVYQSRASRGAFDLLALRGPRQLGVQVKRQRLPLRFDAAEWARLEGEAARLSWRWILLAVNPDDDTVTALDPAKVAGQRTRKLSADAAIDNLLLWLDRG